MASFYAFIVIDVMRDENFKPMTLRDGTPRCCEYRFEISPLRSITERVCKKLDLFGDLEILRNCPHDAIQIRSDALAMVGFGFTPVDPDGTGGATIDGEAFGDVLDEDAIERFKTVQAVMRSPAARLFLRHEGYTSST